MKNPLISVIVPIYNVEKYLDRCVLSLLSQTYDNIEIILVDDGSPDQCPERCDDWALKDNKIKVIHKSNGGLSDARNKGLEFSKGDFICFIDSDDWVSKNFILYLYQSLIQMNADIAECNFVKISKYNINNDSPLEIKQFYETKDALKEIINDINLHQIVCNKLYKKNIINDIKFEKGKINEDEFWTYQIFGNAKRVVKVENSLYYYFQRENSIMNTNYSLKRLDALEAKIQRQEYIDEKFPDLKNVSLINFFGSCIYHGQMILLYLEKGMKKEAIKKLNEIKSKVIFNSKINRHTVGNNKIWYQLAIINFWGTCRLKNFLKKGL